MICFLQEVAGDSLSVNTEWQQVGSMCGRHADDRVWQVITSYLSFCFLDVRMV
jgi:hypothetical protein